VLNRALRKLQPVAQLQFSFLSPSQRQEMPLLTGLFTRTPKSCSIWIVTIRRSILLLLAFLWASAPVLACLRAAARTDAEMACCKKMAGNCEMGAGNHSCCNTTVNTSQAVTPTAQNPQVQPPCIVVAVLSSFHNSTADVASEGVHAADSAIPISPPGSQSILRI
jgi:hypothetical protein